MSQLPTGWLTLLIANQKDDESQNPKNRFPWTEILVILIVVSLFILVGISIFVG